MGIVLIMNDVGKIHGDGKTADGAECCCRRFRVLVCAKNRFSKDLHRSDLAG